MSEGNTADVLSGTARFSLFHGNCLDMLRQLPDNSIDSMVTDPPSGIAFMQRAWDKDKGGRDKWIAWLAEIMRESLRVLKPGAHGFVWSLPRTSHWTAMALEDAGFEVVDSWHHVFGSGFPKSLNISMAIDERDFRIWLKAHPAEREFYVGSKQRAKQIGGKRGAELKRRVERILKKRARLEREIVSSYIAGGNAGTSIEDKGGTYGVGVANSDPVELHVTRGATEKSREWDGYGTAAKPAHEVWWLVQKPIEKGFSIAENVLKWGTGALNIDGCRVASGADHREKCESAVGCSGPRSGVAYNHTLDHERGDSYSPAGRWPPNFLLTHDARCLRIGSRSVKANPTWDTPNRECKATFTGETVSEVRHGEGGVEAVPVYACHESCPVAEMDRQSGELGKRGNVGVTNRGKQVVAYGQFGQEPGDAAHWHDNGGSASRFFPQFEWDPELDDITPFLYIAKPSRSEKDLGLDYFRERTGGEATDREDDSAGTNNPRAGAGRTGGARNVHPTSKGVGLIEFLTKFVTRPGGIVIDLFSGGGTGGVAAIKAGFRWIGADINDTDDEPFISIARARITYAFGGLYIPRESLRAKEPPRQVNMFEVAS